MKNLFMKLLNTFEPLGELIDVCMYRTVSNITLKHGDKIYVLSIRQEEEKKDA